MSKPTPSIPASSHTSGLSEAWRTAITFLLFVHLFALGVATFSNPPSSSLVRRFRNTPVLMQYLQLLYMDNNYKFAHTLGSPMDMGTEIRVELSRPTAPDGEATKTVSFPEEHYWPELRNQRYQNLVYSLQRLCRISQVLEERANPEVVGERDQRLPRAVSFGLMQKYGYTAARLRLRNRYLPAIEDLQGSASLELNPNDETRYELVAIGDSRLEFGEQTFLYQEDARRTAPVPSQTPARNASSEK